jgi:hypothetical protein
VKVDFLLIGAVLSIVFSALSVYTAVALRAQVVPWHLDYLYFGGSLVAAALGAALGVLTFRRAPVTSGLAVILSTAVLLRQLV